jgi:hypothetical protein
MMPRITLFDPFGTAYRIDSRNLRTLEAWFSEVLPLANPAGAAPDVPPANIEVWPMFTNASDADWVTDARVLGRRHPFPADKGTVGMYELHRLHKQLERELAGLRKLAE